MRIKSGHEHISAAGLHHRQAGHQTADMKEGKNIQIGVIVGQAEGAQCLDRTGHQAAMAEHGAAGFPLNGRRMDDHKGIAVADGIRLSRRMIQERIKGGKALS